MSQNSQRARINTWFNNRIALFTSNQDSYFSTRRKYFQGLWISTTDVNHTQSQDGDRVVDNQLSSPSDQAENWQDFFGGPIDAAQPCNFSLTVYEGIGGWGWVLIMEFIWEGIDRNRRSHAVGSEAVSFIEDWHVVTPGTQ